MKTKPYFIVVVLLISVIYGCKKLPEYAFEPKISINEVEIIRDYLDPNILALVDSVTVKINYEDGDGDLGIFNNDIATSDYNYFLKIEMMDNGSYIPYIYPDAAFNFNGKFPELAPSKVKRPIDGVLNYSLIFQHNYFINPNDTLRFEIYIVDRTGNKSNVVVTDPIIIKKQ